ncbi:3-hydroxyacyl-CoA dehydrogenase NAD-binding domain-containing protein [Falsihalocynthiibacter sp. SS001]|uniref:3-hydroxyacyl-CoA dehydrogenase NAD-binding domain-containing protein n=1 Tax=Falsihalocynthiibacter sp. SS001 TaxID=3349698 RepID=UPI0036D2C681
MDQKNSVAVVGCGTVGRNWALLFLRAGWPVRVFDPEANAVEKLQKLFMQARENVPAFADIPQAALSFHTTLSETVRGAVWVQESAPERIDLKRKIYQKLQEHCLANAMIASSSANLSTIEIQSFAPRAKYVLVVRPQDRSFSTERVAILSGPSTPPALLQQAAEFLQDLGLTPEITPN